MRFSNPRQMIAYFMRPSLRWIVFMIALLLLETWVSSIQPLVMAPMVDIALEQENIFTPEAGAATLALSEVTLNNIDQYVSQILDFGERSAWEIVLILSGAFMALVIIKAILGMANFILYTRIRIFSKRNMQSFLFGHLINLSMDFHNQQRTGEIVSRLERDITSSVNSFGKVVRTLATAPIFVLIYSYLLLSTDATLMVLISGVAIVQWILVRWMRDRLKNLVRDEFDLIARLNAYLQEVFQNIRVLKSFAAERFEQERLSQRFIEIIPVHINRALFRYLQEPLVVMINGLANVSILLLSTNELFNGDLNVPGFFLFLYLGRSIISPISQLGSVYLSFQEMEASATRIFEIANKKPKVEGGELVKTGFSEKLSLENIYFSYGAENVINGLTLEIKKGEMVALVGPSGGGKSTISDLILRFYDPDKGNVRVDGIDLKDIDLERYRRLFGVVSQENLLFNDSISNNIAYGRTGISQQEIEQAAKIANADKFISESPEGYETFVGDRGIRLSGGQRQRIAIARAIVHKPEILVLDEATSSLDTDSERLVQEAIERVVKDTTAIVVAHRLSTVKDADKIVVINEGMVVEQGRHHELLESSKLYKALANIQLYDD